MPKLVTLPGLVAALLLLSGCYTHLNRAQTDASARAQFEPGQSMRDIVYTRADWPQALRADLHLPRQRDLYPVVITIHGGGWANRSRDDMESITRKLVRRGYAVFNLSYRFAPMHTYPAQLQDVHEALAWLDANAERYALDLTRINAWGYSSGAHLAALAASFDVGAATGLALPEDLPRIRAVVAGGIPSDLRKYEDSPIIERFIGGKRDALFERYAEASPAYHVSADDPPVFLYHGRFDMMVKRDQATDYYAALRAAGVDAELYLHNWHGHLSLFALGGDAENKAIDFLDRHNQRVVTAAQPLE